MGAEGSQQQQELRDDKLIDEINTGKKRKDVRRGFNSDDVKSGKLEGFL